MADLPIDKKLSDNSTPQVKKGGIFANKLNVLIIFVAVLYVLLFVTGGIALKFYYDNKADQQQNSAKTAIWIPTDYSEMTKDQISVKLHSDTGKDPLEIAKAMPSKELLPSFEKAYSAAQAMYYLNNDQKSLELYAFADTYKSKDKNYVFYLDYAAVAQTVNNNEVFIKQIEAAKAAIKDDKKLSQTNKDDLITSIDEKLARIKAVQ